MHTLTSLFGLALLFLSGNALGVEMPLTSSERVIATDVTLGPVVWCGNDTIAVNVEDKGIVLIDLKTRRTIDVKTNVYSGAVSCSADGAWLFIADTSRSRSDKKTGMTIIDYWLYDIKQKRKTKVASAAPSGGPGVSPDDKAVVFFQPGSVDKNQPRAWRIHRTQKVLSGERGLEHKWLADSRGIVVRHGSEIFIERFDPPVILPLKLALKSKIHRLRVDAHDRVFFLSEAASGNAIRSLIECRIVQPDLTCHARVSRDSGVEAYEISRQGDIIVFVDSVPDWRVPTCLWLLTDKDSRPQCLSTVSSTASELSLSPNGEWVLFTRLRKLAQQDSMGRDYVSDLIAIDR
jgi:hypothetical protein